MGIFTKGINKAAYQGKLTCPTCRSGAIRFVEKLGPYMQRYRCRKCGLPFLYDIGPMARAGSASTNPYAALGSKFTRTMRVPIIGTGHGRTKTKE